MFPIRLIHCAGYPKLSTGIYGHKGDGVGADPRDTDVSGMPLRSLRQPGLALGGQKFLHCCFPGPGGKGCQLG
jgi:hypothetical protein